MKSKATKKNEEINELEGKLQDTIQELNYLRSKFSKLEEEIAKLKEELHNTLRELNYIRVSIKTKKINHEHLLKKFFSLDAENQQIPILKEENRKSQEQIARITEDNSKLEKHLQTLDCLALNPYGTACDKCTACNFFRAELYKKAYTTISDLHHTMVEKLKDALRPFRQNFFGINRDPVTDAFLTVQTIQDHIDQILRDLRNNISFQRNARIYQSKMPYHQPKVPYREITQEEFREASIKESLDDLNKFHGS